MHIVFVIQKVWTILLLHLVYEISLFVTLSSLLRAEMSKTILIV